MFACAIRLFRGLSPVCLALLLLAATPSVLAQWVEFVDDTASRLVSDPSVGVSDFEEKDYGGADLCLSFDPAGHEGFTRQLVDAALARQRRARRRRGRS